MSSTFGIDDALKEFKTTIPHFQQQLNNSGVKYNGTFENAVEEFGLPAGITQDQAHFLLASRLIQKQLTRQPNFDHVKAKENIIEFLKTVNNIKCDFVEEMLDLKDFQLIVSFAELDWLTFDLPKSCLIVDFCYQNDEKLGQEIPVSWNIQFITKGPQVP
uniref:Uncharacterized protein n=1 Tax=Panagrolaimus sp. ES5 TaxID=591445 RepID=A0AC34GJ39_9BILA